MPEVSMSKETVTLALTNQQATAVLSVLNFSSVHSNHIDNVSVEVEAAMAVGMETEDMARCITEVWQALKMEVITEDDPLEEA